MAAETPNGFQTNLLVKTFFEFIEDKCPRMAAALAFYTMLSLAPLLVLTITIAGWMVDPQDVRAELSEQTRTLIGPEGAKQIRSMLEAAGQSDGGFLGKVGSIAVLIFAATAVMAQLQASLNETWDVEADSSWGGVKNFLVKRALSLAMILGIAFLLMVSLVLSALAQAFSKTIVQWLPGHVSTYAPVLAAEAVSLLLITVLFAAMFKVLPDAHVAWRDVWIGAAGTALLFVVGKFFIGLYLGQRDLGSTYGAAGSLVLILLWTYYSSMIFFLGAEFTQVWARRHGKPIQPTRGAVQVVQRRERTEPG
jgi:membrane protein